MQICTILLIFLDSTTASKTVHTQSYQSDEQSKSHRLLAGIIFIHRDDSLIECMNKCNVWAPTCKAFSYSSKSRECFLNELRKRDASKSAFTYKYGFQYYEVA